jgi:type IV fimbrial biogenesis protein FimT
VDRKSLQKPWSGFTLLELMIVLVVLAVILVLGVPSMQSLLHRNRLRSEAGRLMVAINMARSEAIMRNSPVSICPSQMTVSGQAVCSGIYADGWIVFGNPDKDSVVDPDTDEVLRVFGGLPPGYTLTNRAGTRDALALINYLPDGSSHRNRTLLICPTRGSTVSPLSIVINIIGRPRLARNWGQCSPA